MAAQYFLAITTSKGGKVSGESMIDGFLDQIQILRYSLGLRSPLDQANLFPTGRVIEEFAEFEYVTCAASTALYQAINANDVITAATLSCRRVGNKGKDITFLTWIFKDARLALFRNIGSESHATDVIHIAYAYAEIHYTKQKQDGEKGPESIAVFDWGGNK